MPNAVNEDLPPSARNHLPSHARDIYREAFNHAWQHHPTDEATPHRLAWAAVKRGYRKAGDLWVRRDELAKSHVIPTGRNIDYAVMTGHRAGHFVQRGRRRAAGHDGQSTHTTPIV